MAWTWGYREGAEKGDMNRISSRSCGFWLLIASLCWRMDQCQRLLRAFDTACGPLGPEDISWRKYVFQQIQRHPTLPGLLSSCWQNSGLWWIWHHIHWTWTCWTSLSAEFSRQKSRLCLTPIWTPYIRHRHGMGLASSGIQLQDAHSASAVKPSLRKINIKLNRWLANSPTHNNQHF